MKLYNVKMWFIDEDDEEEMTSRLILAESIEEAEIIASHDDNESYDCFEAEEVNETNGYRIIFEKIEE